MSADEVRKVKLPMLKFLMSYGCAIFAFGLVLRAETIPALVSVDDWTLTFDGGKRRTDGATRSWRRIR